MEKLISAMTAAKLARNKSNDAIPYYMISLSKITRVSLIQPSSAEQIAQVPSPESGSPPATAAQDLGADRMTGNYGLEWLLSPVTVRDFTETFWESCPLSITKHAPEFFADLPGLDDLDQLLTATTFGSGRTADAGRLVRARGDGGRDQREFRRAVNGLIDIQDIYRAYEEGYSVVLNGLHQRSAAVAALCRALEADMHHPVGANMYLTPRDGQGFPPHMDTHDVFILQLHGTKEWHVSGGGSDLPLATIRRSLPRVTAPCDQIITLTPGDVLYIPRGVAHEAVTSASSSLHLTVGIHVYRWVDLLTHALSMLAEERISLRQALPCGFLDAPLSGLSKIIDEAALALIDERVAERAKDQLGEKCCAAPMAAQPGQFRSIDRIQGLTIESVVRRPPEGLCRVHVTEDEASIVFAGNYVAGPVAIEPALRFIADHESFAVQDVPGDIPAHDKLELVMRLISEGLLCVPSTRVQRKENR